MLVAAARNTTEEDEMARSEAEMTPYEVEMFTTRLELAEAALERGDVQSAQTHLFDNMAEQPWLWKR
jgi:hypothetical protein